MATTTHTGITLVDQSQAQKEVTVNQGFTRIDALLNSGAKSRTTNTPPGSPASGDLYIVGSSPTGAWSGQAAKLAYYDQIWRFIAPNEGMSLWVNDEDLIYSYNGTAWVASTFGETNTASNLGTGTGIYGTKVGVDLRFKSLVAGTGVTLSNTSNDITINASGGGGGSGTVTSVSVTTANGVSGTVTNPTTTPAISMSLGAITPSSVTATGSVTGSNLSGTNTGDQTITLTGDVTGSGTGSFAASIASNAVGNTQLRQGAARSVVGVTGNATANVADIQGSAGQVLVVNNVGNALAFGAVDVSQSAAVTGIMGATNGGTGNGFTAFSGPATATKTFTLPNASATILTSNAAVTVAQGGTNITSYTTGDLLYASGSSALSRLGAGNDGQILRTSGTSAAPAWVDNPPSFRNGLINGDCSVAQRGTSFSSIAASVVQTLDGWFGYSAAGAAQSVTRQSGVAGNGFNYCMRVQRPNANSSTALHRVLQIIETIDCYRFAGQSCTLSYYLRVGANFSSTNVTVSVMTGTGSDEGSASVAAGTWTGLATPLNSNISPTTSWVRYTHSLSIASNATEIAIKLLMTPTGTAGAADYFEVTGLQLELGSPTAYEYLPASVNLSRCQRYYQKTFSSATAPAQNAGTTDAAVIVSQAATTFGQSFDYAIPMRVAPTVTTYNPSATNANWRDTTNSTDKTATVGTVGLNSVVISGATGAASGFNRIHYSLEAAL